MFPWKLKLILYHFNEVNKALATGEPVFSGYQSKQREGFVEGNHRVMTW